MYSACDDFLKISSGRIERSMSYHKKCSSAWIFIALNEHTHSRVIVSSLHTSLIHLDT